MDDLEDKKKTLERETNDANKRAVALITMKNGLGTCVGKMLGGIENIEATLSCLSCLNFLEEPLMLVCGHSICKTCFKMHSDPSSKDSLVFCEECKLETKNRDLSETKVIRELC